MNGDEVSSVVNAYRTVTIKLMTTLRGGTALLKCNTSEQQLQTHITNPYLPFPTAGAQHLHTNQLSQWGTVTTHVSNKSLGKEGDGVTSTGKRRGGLMSWQKLRSEYSLLMYTVRDEYRAVAWDQFSRDK